MAEVVRRPNPVDVHVGNRMRVRRRVMELSQESLADSLGLTFQQVQKYERGANRVSASNLFGVAAALQVPVSYFFAGLTEPDAGLEQPARAREASGAIDAFLATAEGLELAQRFPRIPGGRMRRQVLELVRALTEATEPAPEPAE